MIKLHSKYDNMHKNEIFYALICINNHIFECQYCKLSDTKDMLWMDNRILIMTYEYFASFHLMFSSKFWKFIYLKTKLMDFITNITQEW